MLNATKDTRTDESSTRAHMILRIAKCDREVKCGIYVGCVSLYNACLRSGCQRSVARISLRSTSAPRENGREERERVVVGVAGQGWTMQAQDQEMAFFFFFLSRVTSWYTPFFLCCCIVHFDCGFLFYLCDTKG